MAPNNQIAIRAKQSKLETLEDEITATNILHLLTQGKNRKQIIQELQIEPTQYDHLILTTLKQNQPSQYDINRERTIAHQRYLNIYQELNELNQNSEKPTEKLYILKEIRATTKEIADLYGVKMPEKHEIEIIENTDANKQAQDLIALLTSSKQQPIIEVQAVEEDTQESGDTDG